MIKDLSKLINNPRISIIEIASHEEKRMMDVLQSVAARANLPLQFWSIASGLFSLPKNPSNKKNFDAEKTLRHIWNLKNEGIYVLMDFHHHLSDPLHIRLIKEIAQNAINYDQTIVFLSHDIELPGELEPFSARLDISLPTESKLQVLFKKVVKKWLKQNPDNNFQIDEEAARSFIKNLKGLSRFEAERLILNALRNEAITQEDVKEVAKAKYDLLNKEGVLYFEHDTFDMTEVGGLENLKQWLQKRKPIFLGEHKLKGIDLPRGLLLLGIQGGGKSLAAKAIAGSWGIPLLRLDFGSLFDKFHGETERKLRESLDMAERMDPCVLWLDEIEKGLAQDNNDSGTSQRLLGKLLTWMAERESAVLIVATSNDIKALPPELLRKGRMDEIFFVDLPDQEVRKEIFDIHLQQRNISTESLNLDKLAVASKGFSGAEIEQAIISALYSTVEGSGKLTQSLLIGEINATHPLSTVMEEKINAMRRWAQDRTVSAN